MTTHYRSFSRPQTKSVQSNRVINVQDINHPVRRDIKTFCETYALEAQFEEDTQTLQALGTAIPGLIAIICTLKKDGQVVAFGRSCAVFSSYNKYISRTINTALNGSFLSAANNACKVFEALRTYEAEGQTIQKFQKFEASHKPTQHEESGELATDKQVSLLESLVAERISSPAEREKWQKEIDAGMSRLDASEKISSFLMDTR